MVSGIRRLNKWFSSNLPECYPDRQTGRKALLKCDKNKKYEENNLHPNKNIFESRKFKRKIITVVEQYKLDRQNLGPFPNVYATKITPSTTTSRLQKLNK